MCYKPNIIGLSVGSSSKANDQKAKVTPCFGFIADDTIASKDHDLRSMTFSSRHIAKENILVHMKGHGQLHKDYHWN